MHNLATVFDFLFGCHHSNLSASLRSGARLIACVAIANRVQVFTRDDVH